LVSHIRAIAQTGNQLTLPDFIIKHLGVKPGGEVMVSFDDDEPGVHLRPFPLSFAGATRGIYGSATEAATFLENERAVWNE
jgi:hypothetical protein